MYTKNELIYAFNLWATNELANPDDFEEVDAETYGQRAADYVAELLA
jgi:hypothetical protein